MGSLNYSIGRIRAMESFLLSQDFLQKVLFAKDFNSAISLLAENKRWGQVIKSFENSDDYLAMLEIEQRNVIALLLDLSERAIEIEALSKKHFMAFLQDDYLQDLKLAAQKSNSALFRKIVYASEVFWKIIYSLLQGGSPDTTLQKYAFVDFSKEIQSGIEEFKKGRDFSALDKEYDNILLKTAKIAKYESFGINPLIGFFISQEMEIKNLQLILSSKKNGVNPEKTKNYLRASYV